VHRDLKPGNIFSDDGIVKVGDYGLSKFISCSRRSGQTESVGTVHYMAPEIANGRYGKEIDIYALGIILYEMLTGHVPFDGESVGEVLMKHLTAEPVMERVPAPYRTAIAKALTKDPDQRVRTLGELVALLPVAASECIAPDGGPTVEARLGDPRDALPPGAAADPAPVIPAVLVEAPVEPAASFWHQEPVARSAVHLGRRFAAWWNGPALTSGSRTVLLVVAAIMATMLFPYVMALFVVVGVVYCAYLTIFAVTRAALGPPSGVRGASTFCPRQEERGPSPSWREETIVHHDSEGYSSPSAAAADRHAWAGPLPPPKSRRERLARFHHFPLGPSPPKPFAQRVSELTGSMLLAAILVAPLALVMCILRGEVPDTTQYVWLALTSLAGAWIVLVPAKIWEGRPGEAVLRRFTMMVLGLGLGVVAHGIKSWLLVDLPSGRSGPMRVEEVAKVFSSGNLHELWSHVAYFGFLFVLPAWWYQAHPDRANRVGIIVTAIAVGWAALICTFWPYPWPWGIMTAATISLAVQLASPRSAKSPFAPAAED
jgi:hypothetical protein